MKSMSKSELALAAGISLSTLARWMKPYRQELEALGLRPGMRVLPPRVKERHLRSVPTALYARKCRSLPGKGGVGTTVNCRWNGS